MPLWRLLMKLKNGIFPSQSFGDVFRKIKALHAYFVGRKNKME